jgi:Dyp-type peroxidase family
MPSATVDLSDIQGNILFGYRSQPQGRFLFFGIRHPESGRQFIERLCPLVTTAKHHEGRARRRERLEQAVNIALSAAGLAALGLPGEALASFPAAFQQGMKARAAALGDVGPSAPQYWDLPWREGVALLVMVYGATPGAVDSQCEEILRGVPAGIDVLGPAQDVAVLPSSDNERREHFGFVDGLSNPEVEGCGNRDDIGNPDDHGGFGPVALGEFILGYPDEGGEMSEMPQPVLLARNGTFLVLRKLHQHVAQFRKYLGEQAKAMAKVVPAADPEFLAAKMVGRWRDGTSLMRSPAPPGTTDRTNGFGYGDDPEGSLCPLGAHVRRAFPRDSLDFGAIVARRRMIRRGITYGEPLPAEATEDDEQPRGIMFLAYNASIERQFEFVQQQWINGGDPFEQGNTVDPLVGTQRRAGRMMIPGDGRTGRTPFLCHGMQQFVSTRGGEYFFVPSPTALRLITSGRVVVA